MCYSTLYTNYKANNNYSKPWTSKFKSSKKITRLLNHRVFNFVSYDDTDPLFFLYSNIIGDSIGTHKSFRFQSWIWTVMWLTRCAMRKSDIK
jgi:hypothetical protein